MYWVIGALVIVIMFLIGCIVVLMRNFIVLHNIREFAEYRYRLESRINDYLMKNLILTDEQKDEIYKIVKDTEYDSGKIDFKKVFNECNIWFDEASEFMDKRRK